MRLYIDGVLDKSDDGGARNPNRFGEFSLQIGFFSGLVDEVTVYSSALTTEEVQGLFLAGSAGKCTATFAPCPPGVVSLWPGEGDGSDIIASNSGILVNGPSVTFQGHGPPCFYQPWTPGPEAYPDFLTFCL